MDIVAAKEEFETFRRLYTVDQLHKDMLDEARAHFMVRGGMPRITHVHEGSRLSVFVTGPDEDLAVFARRAQALATSLGKGPSLLVKMDILREDSFLICSIMHSGRAHRFQALVTQEGETRSLGEWQPLEDDSAQPEKS